MFGWTLYMSSIECYYSTTHSGASSSRWLTPWVRPVNHQVCSLSRAYFCWYFCSDKVPSSLIFNLEHWTMSYILILTIFTPWREIEFLSIPCMYDYSSPRNISRTSVPQSDQVIDFTHCRWGRIGGHDYIAKVPGMSVRVWGTAVICLKIEQYKSWLLM